MSDDEIVEPKEGESGILDIDEAFEEEVPVDDTLVDMSAEFEDDEDIEEDFVTDEERDGMY